ALLLQGLLARAILPVYLRTIGLAPLRQLRPQRQALPGALAGRVEGRHAGHAARDQVALVGTVVDEDEVLRLPVERLADATDALRFRVPVDLAVHEVVGSEHTPVEAHIRGIVLRGDRQHDALPPQRRERPLAIQMVSHRALADESFPERVVEIAGDELL